MHALVTTLALGRGAPFGYNRFIGVFRDNPIWLGIYLTYCKPTNITCVSITLSGLNSRFEDKLLRGGILNKTYGAHKTYMFRYLY